MPRAFIHQGVWRIQPLSTVDAPAQRRATLRVSAVAAAVTLAIAALHDGGAREAAPPRKAVVIAAPELVLVKAEDRVPAAPLGHSPFRRRASAADMAAPEAAALPEPAPTPASAPVREAEAVDAAMIRAGDETFRLAGILPPEAGRSCRRLDGLAVSCADRAQSYLHLLIKGRAVVCGRAPQSSDGPAEAHCRVGDSDLAEQLVRQGWARAAEKPEERFLLAEAAARKQKLGIWRE